MDHGKLPKNQWLVGGFNPTEKCLSVGIILPEIWKNKKNNPNHQPGREYQIDGHFVPGYTFPDEPSCSGFPSSPLMTRVRMGALGYEPTFLAKNQQLVVAGTKGKV
jgi:hypothetical protein